MSFKTIKPSFAGGELSPALAARVDLSKYHVGARELKNCFVHPHGGASNRAGTEFVAEAKYPDKPVKMLDFVFSREQSYALEFGDGYIRFYTQGVQLMVEAGKPYEIPSIYKVEDLPYINTTQSSDYLYIACRDKPPMQLVRRGHIAWELMEFPFKQGPFLNNQTLTNYVKVTAENAVLQKAGSQSYTTAGTHTFVPPAGVTNVSVTLEGATASYLKNPFLWYEAGGSSSFGTLSVAGQSGQYGNPQGQGPEKLVIGNVDVKKGVGITVVVGRGGSAYSGAYQAGVAGRVVVSWSELLDEQRAGTMESKLALFVPEHVGGVWRVRQQVAAQRADYPNATGLKVYSRWNVETSGYWTGTLRVERQNVLSGEWELIRSMTSSKDRNYSETGEVDEATMVRIIGTLSPGMPAGTTGDNGMLGKATLETLPATYDGVVKITEYISSTKVKVEIQKTIANQDWTKEWAEGAWSPRQGYPSCVVFDDDRLVFGGTREEPLMFWGSRAGDYNNFGVSLPVVDSDSFAARLISRKNGRILYLLPLTDLIALTEFGEFRISGDGPKTPTNLGVKPQGERGSAAVEPVVIGSQVIFAQSGGSTIRDLGYSFESDGYSGTDLTILAGHLFKGYQVLDMDYQQEPDSIVWVVRSDGVLIGLTYLKEHDVWAWHHHVTAGSFESVAVIPRTDGRSEVWLSVERDGKRMIERIRERLPDKKVDEAYFVDCGLTYRGKEATRLIGFDHLAGKEVAILADGAVMPRQVVREITIGDITGWGIELVYPAKIVHVGLPYESDIETMPIEIAGANTLQGSRKKIPRVILRVENSIGACVSIDGKGETEIKWRDQGLKIGEKQELFTGDKGVRPDCGYSDDGRIRITQKDPLPLTVLAVIPEIG